MFQDLLCNRDDFLRAIRALFREIVRSLKHEINLVEFCRGLMQERWDPADIEQPFKVLFSLKKLHMKMFLLLSN